MGIKLQRKKKKLLLVRFFYFIDKILPLSKKAKFKFYLNLEWIFDRFSHEYSFKNYSPDIHPVRTTTKRFLLAQLQSHHCVLDLGCNRGDMSAYLADYTNKVVGVDYDKYAIDLAKKKYDKPNLDFICDDVYNYLNSSDITFDVLILSHILEHIEEPANFLAKYAPFFKYVYIELPDFEKTLLNQYRKDSGLSLIYMDADHISEFDREELQQLIEQVNMQIMVSEYKYGIQKVWCKVLTS